MLLATRNLMNIIKKPQKLSPIMPFTTSDFMASTWLIKYDLELFQLDDNYGKLAIYV